MAQRTKKLCIIDGCGRLRDARGWCSSHYSRFREHGTPMAEIPIAKKYESLEERFLDNVEWRGTHLIWVGAKNNKGYGRIAAEGKYPYAHRYSWERSNGPIPKGMEIDHICHVTLCVNPDHLRIANRSQNTSHLNGAKKHSKSGVLNVYPNTTGKPWYVQVRHKGIIHSFGSYDTVEEAAEVAKVARERLHGRFAGR